MRGRDGSGMWRCRSPARSGPTSSRSPVRCFYDADEQIDLWGKYLAEELPAIYAERAAAVVVVVVVFVSAEYAARDWTRLERRAALNRAVQERREYVLPARFDDTPLPGLLSDLVAIDLRGRSPQQFAAMIADKLARLAISAGQHLQQATDTAVPRGSAPAATVDSGPAITPGPHPHRPLRPGLGGGVQPGRAAARHRQPRQHGAAVGLTWTHRCPRIERFSDTLPDRARS
jgi:hypothetical protein